MFTDLQNVQVLWTYRMYRYYGPTECTGIYGPVSVCSCVVNSAKMKGVAKNKVVYRQPRPGRSANEQHVYIHWNTISATLATAINIPTKVITPQTVLTRHYFI